MVPGVSFIVIHSFRVCPRCIFTPLFLAVGEATCTLHKYTHCTAQDQMSFPNSVSALGATFAKMASLHLNAHHDILCLNKQGNDYK